MIIRPKYNWLKLLFVWRGSVLPEILPRLIFVFILSLLVLFFHGEFFSVKVSLNATPFTLMGIALAIFLGFRNSAAYDRFWEGRKIWGSLLNILRTLTRQAHTLPALSVEASEIKKFTQLSLTFVYCLKHQLRHTNPVVDIQRLLPSDAGARIQEAQFRPAVLLMEMGRWVQTQRAQGTIDSMTQTLFDKSLHELSDILGGCERIASTPIPYPYTVLLHRTVYIYCILLPFGLVDSIGWMTPIICVFVAYTFMALDAIVTQIEEPFGVEENDLALDTISKTIELTVREMQGEQIQMPQPKIEEQVVFT
ncbi:MAG: bestrophin family ion channel [Bdellovibrio sp.]